jgi:hypothetical protein
LLLVLVFFYYLAFVLKGYIWDINMNIFCDALCRRIDSCLVSLNVRELKVKELLHGLFVVKLGWRLHEGLELEAILVGDDTYGLLLGIYGGEVAFLHLRG